VNGRPDDTGVDRDSTDNGVVLNEWGYRVAARRIVTGLGYKYDGADEDIAPFAMLRSAIRKKNELFFHRWRPANWTYLFGFRKHEQGQNAVEIPRFDPLIADWDARIAKLRDLKHQENATVKEARSLLAEKPREHRDPN